MQPFKGLVRNGRKLANRRREKKRKKKKKKQMKAEEDINILLLGTTQSGKTTFMNQYEYLFLHKALPRVNNLVHDIRQNCISKILKIVRINLNLQCVKFDWYERIEDDIIAERVKYLIRMPLIGAQAARNDPTMLATILTKILSYIDYLWHLEQIQKMFYVEHRFGNVEGMDYFFNRIDDIFNPYFQPCVQDYVRFYIPSSKLPMECSDYVYRNEKFSVGDTGGSLVLDTIFDVYKCVIFVAALSHFVDGSMRASIEYFKVVCQKFNDQKIVLIMSKNDIFKRYLMNRSLNICFDDYLDVTYLEQKRSFFKQYINNESFPMDIIDQIEKYVDIMQSLFDKCYDKSLEFIKEKYLCSWRSS